jgi:peptide/nickel transport system ATP-binding protein
VAQLEIENLTIQYQTSHGLVHAVRGVTLAVQRGRAMGLVGESGCGKTTLARAVIGVLPKNAMILGGTVQFDGEDLLTLSAYAQNAYRWRRIAMVPQSAMDSLDPVYRVGDQMIETMRQRGGLSRAQARDLTLRLFAQVGLESSRTRLYPHELSGGMKQRVVIAMALALSPQVLIADEPVTALDVIVQHQVLAILHELQKTLQLSLLLITHDISVVADLCDDVAVMYAGRIVETGSVRQVFNTPQHPYTMGLRNAFPSLRAQAGPLVPIEGFPPDLARPPRGCAFAPRCPFVIDRCWTEDPALLPVAGGRASACHRASDAALLRTQASEAFARLSATPPGSAL